MLYQKLTCSSKSQRDKEVFAFNLIGTQVSACGVFNMPLTVEYIYM